MWGRADMHPSLREIVAVQIDFGEYLHNNWWSYTPGTWLGIYISPASSIPTMIARFSSLTRVGSPNTTLRYAAAVRQANWFRLSRPLPRLSSNMSQRLATLDV